MIKTIALAILNAVVVMVAYLAIGNVLHSLTGEYIDQLNMSSILTVAACIAILAGATMVERRWTAGRIWPNVTTSLATIVIVGVGMAVAVALIAGGIG